MSDESFRFKSFLNKANKLHQFKYNYSKSIFKNCKTHIIIICPTHGEFKQAPTKHLYGGCQKCGFIKCSKSRTMTTKSFIKKSVNIHKDLYDYSLVIYTGRFNKVKIICKNHGIFEQAPSCHLDKFGCKKCAFNVLTNDDFTKKANQIHDFKYDYSLVDIKNILNKIKIICLQHGEFYQRYNQHLIGSGCKKCGDKALSVNDLIKKAHKIHNNKFKYNLISYKNNTEKLNIICPIHNFFKQSISSHLSGSDCPKCSYEKKRLSEKDVLDKFVQKHGLIYDYSKVSIDITSKKVEIICKKHGSFFQTVNSHSLGANCPLCASKKRFLTLEEFVKKSQNIHGSEYNYDKVKYVNNIIKVIITCYKHGDFKQAPVKHMLGNKCKKCISDMHKIVFNNSFINKSKVIHYNKYDYSLVNYIKSIKKVVIKCPMHGEFKQTPNSHLSGVGCIKCTNRYSPTNDEFINNCKLIHGDKFNYDLVIYSGSHQKIKIKCSKHGVFKQLATSHLSGAGCPVCSSNTSLVEKEWLDSLNIPIEDRQITIKLSDKKYRVDAYTKFNNTIYEFNGDFWHGNPKIFKSEDLNKKNKKTFGELYQKTLEKESDLKSFGYNVISIWQADFVKNIKI